jgi:hypothetical protein
MKNLKIALDNYAEIPAGLLAHGLIRKPLRRVSSRRAVSQTHAVRELGVGHAVAVAVARVADVHESSFQ